MLSPANCLLRITPGHWKIEEAGQERGREPKQEGEKTKEGSFSCSGFMDVGNLRRLGRQERKEAYFFLTDPTSQSKQVGAPWEHFVSFSSSFTAWPALTEMSCCLGINSTDREACKAGWLRQKEGE